MYGDYQEACNGQDFRTCKADIWNPSIRKVVDVGVPNVAYGLSFETVVGFGVCHKRLLTLRLSRLHILIGGIM